VIGALLGLALAASPCLDAELTSVVPDDAPSFEPRPTEQGLELDERTYERWLWRQRRLAGCIIELRAALNGIEQHEQHADWLQTEAEEAVRRARPSWFQRHGFTIGVIVGTGITVALVAAVAKTLRISIEGA